jgi:GST-like protein
VIVATTCYATVRPIVTWREGSEQRVLVESGAILLAFAERFGRLLPPSGKAREDVLAWLMIALTSLGPLSGQAHHWTALDPEKPPAATEHYKALLARCYRVLDEQLTASEYLADAYSIADIAAFPWVERIGWTGLDLAEFPSVVRWRSTLAQRPAVARGVTQPKGVTMN